MIFRTCRVEGDNPSVRGATLVRCGGVIESMEVAEIPTYAEIVETTAPRLMRLAVMLTGSREDAEDLLQTTLLRTHRHADRLEVMAAPQVVQL